MLLLLPGVSTTDSPAHSAMAASSVNCRGSRAARSGLRAGDVVLAAGNARAGDLPALRAALSEAPDRLVLHIQRGRGQGNLLME